MRKHRSPAFTAIAALTVTAGLGACETPQQVTDLTAATRDNFVALKKQIGKFETTAKSLDRRYAESLARQEKNLDDTFESMRDTQDVFLMRTGASVKASNALVGKWLTYDPRSRRRGAHRSHFGGTQDRFNLEGQSRSH